MSADTQTAPQPGRNLSAEVAALLGKLQQGVFDRQRYVDLLVGALFRAYGHEGPQAYGHERAQADGERGEVGAPFEAPVDRPRGPVSGAALSEPHIRALLAGLRQGEVLRLCDRPVALAPHDGIDRVFIVRALAMHAAVTAFAMRSTDLGVETVADEIAAQILRYAAGPRQGPGLGPAGGPAATPPTPDQGAPPTGGTAGGL